PPALVLAGGQGHDDEIDRAVAEVPPHLRLLRPGYLRYADLPGFLGGALVACYPSFGEGFGLPILEAMACATPVLPPPRLSLPAVGGLRVFRRWFRAPDPGGDGLRHPGPHHAPPVAARGGRGRGRVHHRGP